jgi:hypothetical protein
MEVFPKGRYDDLTDSTTQAIRYLRDNACCAPTKRSMFGQWTACGTSQGRSRLPVLGHKSRHFV